MTTPLNKRNVHSKWLNHHPLLTVRDCFWDKMTVTLSAMLETKEK